MQGRADLNWDDVRVLLALARSRTLGEAAERLGLDGSTVSRRLTGLESTLASTLFQRGRSGITKTEAVEGLIPVAEEIEQAVARLTKAAEALEQEVSGEVRIACPPDAAEVRLVPILPELMARHPALRVHIVAGERIVDVAGRGADLALRVVRPEQGELLLTRLGTVPWVAAASPSLVRRLGTLGRWEDAPWLGYGEELRNIPAARWLSSQVPGFYPVLRSDSIRVQIVAAAQGLGAALIPLPSAEHFGLVPLRMSAKLRHDAQSWPEDNFFMVTHRTLRRVPRVRAVWDFLLEHLGGMGVG